MNIPLPKILNRQCKFKKNSQQKFGKKMKMKENSSDFFTDEKSKYHKFMRIVEFSISLFCTLNDHFSRENLGLKRPFFFIKLPK